MPNVLQAKDCDYSVNNKLQKKATKGQPSRRSAFPEGKVDFSPKAKKTKEGLSGNPEGNLPLGKGAQIAHRRERCPQRSEKTDRRGRRSLQKAKIKPNCPPQGQPYVGRPQTQPSKRCKMKTVADPERRRWRFGITMRPVVPFVPLIGDSSCGSNAGVERRFFDGYRRFFAPVKEMGVHY